MLNIASASCGFEVEPLSAPFGFKGKHIDVLWQSAVRLQDDQGRTGCAPGVQSVVWSDAAVFETLGQAGGNRAMFAITREAVKMVRGRRFEDPIEMIRAILPELMPRAKAITGAEDLRPTFVLNALVPLDLAAWQLRARTLGTEDFDRVLPEAYRDVLDCRHERLAGIPLLSYNVSCEDAARLARQGAFFIKIKLGCDPEGDGDPEKMLAWDMERVTRLHAALRDVPTPYTDTGRPAYYFDANGRYDSKARLMRLVEHLDKIGALEQTVLIEEPFPEGSKIDVHDIPARVAADESAHSARDAEALMDLGYGAMALKPIAKTLSVSLEVAKLAHARGVPCFCADLTVNPVMVDWNKNVAARLGAIPGLKVGALESNGSQNYPDWARLKGYHPMPDAPWIDPVDGLFELGEAFYAVSGGVFRDSAHYLARSQGDNISKEGERT